MLLAGIFLPAGASAAEVTLVKDGASDAAIYVLTEDLEDQKVRPQSGVAKDRLRKSVEDLSRCIEKMSGAAIPIVTEAPADEDDRFPILVGGLAEKRFGGPKQEDASEQGWRLVVSSDGIGMIGQSPLAMSYAVYGLLDRLGCRWYMPGPLGEVVPERKTVALPAVDISEVPATVYRGRWAGDANFIRRNRGGGQMVAVGHALEGYAPKELLEKHPKWRRELNGKRTPGGYCFSNKKLAHAVGDVLIKRSENQEPYRSQSLCPVDTISFCTCRKCRKFDKKAGDWDASMSRYSITDRLIRFCNWIAERVNRTYPEETFGLYAYVQYTRPPVREAVNPNIVIGLAPITYCRAHSMTDPDCFSCRPLQSIVEGWGKVSKRLYFRGYAFNLAEVTAPYPMMKRWSDNIPILYAGNVTIWAPETMPTYGNSLPGMFLGVRMSWYTKAGPAKLLDDLFTGFYGAAAGPMRSYWEGLDRAWTGVPEHAGNGWSYLRRFTPEVMTAARKALDQAARTAQTDLEEQRVELANDSFRFFELWMKMRRDLCEGRLKNLKKDEDVWMTGFKKLAGEKYKGAFAFPGRFGPWYFQRFFYSTYEDAARIANTCTVVTPPLRKWKYKPDKEKKGESLGWQNPEFSDADWPSTDPCVDTWSALGLWEHYGSVWYRAKVSIPKTPPGKKAYLWISGVDSTAKLFVNGKHVSFVNKKGEVVPEMGAGYPKPGSFDITSVIKPGKENQIAIVGTRTYLNELGTGGLLGPVYVYHGK